MKEINKTQKKATRWWEKSGRIGGGPDRRGEKKKKDELHKQRHKVYKRSGSNKKKWKST